MKPLIKSEMKSTFHHDGSVSYWSTHTQQWQRVGAKDLTNSIDFATLNSDEQERVKKTATRGNT